MPAPELTSPVSDPSSAQNSEQGPVAEPDRLVLDPKNAVGWSDAAVRYETRKSLGKGGMGEVQLCRDHLIGRDVAKKLLLDEHVGDATMQARFLREVRIQGQLEHPAIVPVYDLGVDPQGSVFFMMKRLRGKTLAEILEALEAKDVEAEREYPRRRLLNAFLAVCQAVQFAHAHGVLHRDLKPSNIMLGAFGEVYVLDWGVARLTGVGESVDKIEADVSDQIELKTTVGAIVGTLGYLSPEQARGQNDSLDARSDVYSLGAILFEILTLSPLHEREGRRAMLFSTLTGGSAPPSQRTPDRDIPPELDAICVKATSLEKDERYATARAFHDAVEAFLAGDRDIELRRNMARGHVEVAEQAASEAAEEGSSLEARRKALREAGRALALEPTNAPAARVVIQMLTLPPSQVPAEVEQTLCRLTANAQDMRLKVVAVASFSLIPISLVFCLWLGVRPFGLVIAMLAGVFVMTLTSLVALRAEKHRSLLFYIESTSAVISICLLSRIGLALIPMWFAVLSANVGAADQPAQRVFGLIALFVGICISIGMEVLGVLPMTNGMAQFNVNANLPSLAMFTTAAFVGAAAPWIAMNKLRTFVTDAHRSSVLQTWHLRNLLPEERNEGESD